MNTRPFVAFSRAEYRPETLRRLPPGWTLTDLDRADRADRRVGWLCAAAALALALGLGDPTTESTPLHHAAGPRAMSSDAHREMRQTGGARREPAEPAIAAAGHPPLSEADQ